MLWQHVAMTTKPALKMLVPRRIDVLKDDSNPDTYLRMEVDDTTTYVVPIGPSLVATLIEALERTKRVLPRPSILQ